MIAGKKNVYTSNTEMKASLEELRTEFRYLKSAVESLEKSIRTEKELSRHIDGMGREIVDFRSRVDVLAPIVETLLAGKLMPKLVDRLIGNHIEDVTPPNPNTTARPWPPPMR